jgi:hypothetical protein
MATVHSGSSTRTPRRSDVIGKKKKVGKELMVAWLEQKQNRQQEGGAAY